MGTNDALGHVVEPSYYLKKAAAADHGIVQLKSAEAVSRRIAVLSGALESCEELSPFDIHVAGYRHLTALPALKLRVVA